MTTPAPAPTSPTPILDRLVPPPPRLPVKAKPEKSRWIGLAVAIVAVLVPVFWIYLMMHSAAVLRWSSKITPTMDRWLKVIFGDEPISYTFEFVMAWRSLSLLIAGLAVTVVHELGHVIAGKLAGFQLVAVQIGRLQITPPFHLKWHRRDPLPGAAGFVQHLPVYSRNLRHRSMAACAGGPAANLISALLVFLLPQRAVFSVWFIGLSIFAALMNLIPFRRPIISDGARLLTLLRNTHEEERTHALLQLLTDLDNGTEPQNLDPGFLGLATAIQDNSFLTVYGHHLAYASAYYKHDDAEAARLLEICLQYSNCALPSARQSFFGSAVVFQATRRKRVDLARQWLAEIPEKTLIPGLRLRVEAVILEGEGDLQGALKKRDEAETTFRDSAEAKKRELTLRFFRRWGKEVEEKLAPPR